MITQHIPDLTFNEASTRLALLATRLDQRSQDMDMMSGMTQELVPSNTAHFMHKLTLVLDDLEETL